MSHKPARRDALHFCQTPPPVVPLPFLLLAPLFAAASLLLLWLAGPQVFITRWQPQLIGALHFYTLGFLGMSMIGAVLQLGPVLGGKPPSRHVGLARSLRGLLVGGLIAFGCGLYHGVPLLLRLAVVLLAGMLLLAIPLMLRNMNVSGTMLSRGRPSSPGLPLAPIAFAIAASIGLRLLAGHAWPQLGLPRQLTDLHASWALAGWVGVLVISVATEVVPMFQHTSAFPRWISWLPVGILLALLFGSWSTLQPVAAFAVVAMLAAFAVTVLLLQWRRRTGTGDITLRFFRLGMFALLLALAVWLVGRIEPRLQARTEIAAGILYLAGFAASCVYGMAIKIVPFLVRLHLQRQLWKHMLPAEQLPDFRQLINGRHPRHVLQAHAWGVGLLALFVLAGGEHAWLFHLGLLSMTVASVLLLASLWSTIATGYRMNKAAILQAAVGS